MALNVRTTGSQDYQKYIKMLVCGGAGLGKTLMSSTAPNVLYASAEGGMMSVAEKNLPVMDITKTSQIQELIVALDQVPKVRAKIIGHPIDTVVIDTIDEVARIFVAERIESEKKESMAIQDWGWLGDQLRGMIRSLRNLEMNVIFTSHLKSTEDAETSRMFFKPAIQGAMGDEIAAYVDLAVLLTARPVMRVVNGENVRTVVRTMQTYPDVHHPWIKDRSGKLPMEFPINFKDDFARLQGYIYGDAPVKADEPQAPVVVSEPVKPVKAPEAKQTVATPQTKPEPVETVSLPQPELMVEPEVVKTDPVEIVVPEPMEIISESETSNNGQEPAKREDWQTCQECEGLIDNRDIADLSFIRFKTRMCRVCFTARRKAQK